MGFRHFLNADSQCCWTDDNGEGWVRCTGLPVAAIRTNQEIRDMARAMTENGTLKITPANASCCDLHSYKAYKP